MLRAAVTAAVSTVATSAAHAAAGGHLPAVPVLAAVLAFSVLGAYLLCGSRVTLLGRALSVTLSQVLLHGAFTILGHATAVASPGHSHAGGREPFVLHEVSAAAPPASMPWLHVIAGAATVAALQTGAHTLRLLARALGLSVVVALRLVGAPPVASRQRARVPAAPPVRGPRLLLLAASCARRGPPAAVPA